MKILCLPAKAAAVVQISKFFIPWGTCYMVTQLHLVSLWYLHWPTQDDDFAQPAPPPRCLVPE